jgi:hypothetical protein
LFIILNFIVESLIIGLLHLLADELNDNLGTGLIVSECNFLLLWKVVFEFLSLM